MLLGTRQYATNDVRAIKVNYTDWLIPGYTLSSVTATISPTTGILSTVGTIILDPIEMTAYITLRCGSVNETFTLLVVAKDTYGQTINDQLNVNIVAPGAT